jgi:hypothetical protein
MVLAFTLWILHVVKVAFQFGIRAFIRVTAILFRANLSTIIACFDSFTTSSPVDSTPSWDVSILLGITSLAGILDFVFILGAEQVVLVLPLGCWLFLLVEVALKISDGTFIRVTSRSSCAKVSAVIARFNLFSTSSLTDSSPTAYISLFLSESRGALFS